ncbi:carbohydrate kinase family protein [Bradyrhizobium sp. BRP14]|nr:carbohydrate kinase family protein [Bradyrhizobium sp. BRP14]
MILLLGSINSDLEFRGVASLGGGTVRTAGFTEPAGGKAANVAVFTHRLGTATRLLGRIGNDYYAKVASNPLRKAGVDLTGRDLHRQGRDGHCHRHRSEERRQDDAECLQCQHGMGERGDRTCSRHDRGGTGKFPSRGRLRRPEERPGNRLFECRALPSTRPSPRKSNCRFSNASVRLHRTSRKPKDS